jgi:hypothetical protein
MQAFDLEQSIIGGKNQAEELFGFVEKMAFKYSASEMEKAIFTRAMEIGLFALKAYFAVKGTGDIGSELVLSNGIKLKKQRVFSGRDYFSIFGKLKVPRTCYRKEGEAGVMPLDAEANLPERCYSYLLQEWMNVFSIRETFGESHQSVYKLLGLDISPSRFEIVSRESSRNYEQFYDEKEPPESESEGELEVIGFDGKGVPVIKKEAAKLKSRQGKGEKRQKKKEAMVGVSYTVNRNIRMAEEVAKNLVYPEESRKKLDKESLPARGSNIRRIASLEQTKEEVVKQIVKDVHTRNPDQSRPLVVVMDGALHLWSLVALLLKGIKYTGILDIIHVVEYLWKAVNAMNGEKCSSNKQWVHEHLLYILEGHVGWVIVILKKIVDTKKFSKSRKKAIMDVIRYFENHREWMQYDKYLKAGYPVGSGVVESTCGHTVKDRMEGAGRRWSIEGAESTLLLRSVYTSNDWNAYWASHMKIERDRLYHRILPFLTIQDAYSSADDVEKYKAA